MTLSLRKYRICIVDGDLKKINELILLEFILYSINTKIAHSWNWFQSAIILFSFLFCMYLFVCSAKIHVLIIFLFLSFYYFLCYRVASFGKDVYIYQLSYSYSTIDNWTKESNNIKKTWFPANSKYILLL